MAPDGTAPPPDQPDLQAASGRSIGVSADTFGHSASGLFENGYEPIPIRPGTKKPALDRWPAVNIDVAVIERWSRSFPAHGIGLRTGTLVGVDIDILDPDLAYRIEQLAVARLGDTLVRVGLWPKRLLLYRTHAPFAKLSVRGVEVLGKGQQFVAFGIHEDTRQPYYWPSGDTPLDVPLADLPLVDADGCREVLAEARAWLPPDEPAGGRRRSNRPGTASPEPVRDEQGQVIDGRDGWLSSIAYHAVHDALAAGQPLILADLAEAVWRRFTATADVSRPRKDSRILYCSADAARKVADKLRLHAHGRLPPRDSIDVEAAYVAPTGTVAEAREGLTTALTQACREVEAWHGPEPPATCPQIGIRATVGLGKSAIARTQLLGLRARLAASGASSRIVVFTPSHALAEEAAAEWRREGVRVAVLRGYEARDAGTGKPMCRDLDAVRQAVAARMDVHGTACSGSGDRRCTHFDGCLKQANRREVEAAEVVFASYDALFTGFATNPATVGVILIDEGCWQRAATETRGLRVESFADELDGFICKDRERDACALADLLELRKNAAAALAANGPGPVRRSQLLKVGLTARDCSDAALLEERRLRDPGLYPGMPKAERRNAQAQVRTNERTFLFMTIWRTMAELLAGPNDGRLEIRPASAAGAHEIVATGVKQVHRTFRGKPVLHLDATLRPELARNILPRLEVSEIDAAAPHMSVRLIAGSFGKSTLCRDPRAGPEENQRRANRLCECVDYVRWQALRTSPGRILVVTYKDCETAFAGIPGVEVAHFNAIAGLDRYRDVGLLVIVGRPLPSELALHTLCGAFFAHAPSGGYRSVARGVRMRDGTSRTVRVIEHEDDLANVLRAAVCDDELIQAIGRGRGVNRTAQDPLEVHVLADVALPLVHDQVLAWETVKPEIMQRMLLEGIAVDSPADAAALHPNLLSGQNQAKKAFLAAGFKGQNPMSNIYREMALKSGRYRRPGPGRSWQQAWWISGDSEATRARLTEALGDLAEWIPAEP